jgi:CCR4-NOT transcription complex subunit 1
MDAVASNRLIVAIPFVCKILEQCKSSKVFRPPNPWLMALLGFLAELYTFAELKLNLKFEIEVMCKNADFDLKGIHACFTLIFLDAYNIARNQAY